MAHRDAICLCPARKSGIKISSDVNSVTLPKPPTRYVDKGTKPQQRLQMSFITEPAATPPRVRSQPRPRSCCFSTGEESPASSIAPPGTTSSRTHYLPRLRQSRRVSMDSSIAQLSGSCSFPCSRQLQQLFPVVFVDAAGAAAVAGVAAGRPALAQLGVWTPEEDASLATRAAKVNHQQRHLV